MTTPVAAVSRISGVCYASTDDGLELPVIDVTHPAFHERDDAKHIEATIASTMASFERYKGLDDDQRRAMAEGSVLTRGMLAAAGTWMSGLMTYLYKLGPANMGDWANAVDRAIAAGITPLSMRLRLRHVAELLADAAEPLLRARRGPLQLVNIAGGTGIDSLNALILLRQRCPEELVDREVEIRVLDCDPTGPAWGRRALEALCAPAAPLAGLRASMIHAAYDWDEPGHLRVLLGRTVRPNAIVVASSEGGLFEYPNDARMVDNLRILRDGTPADSTIVGTIVRDAGTMDPRLAPMEAMPGRPAIRFLGVDGFRPLATSAGWSIVRVRSEAIHQVVLLQRTR